MDFYLGVDTPGLLWEVPIMLSYGRLRRRNVPRATAPWICDSRGFTELQQYGTWTISPKTYAERLTFYADQIGMLRWAAPQDWMCEPKMLTGTGKTITEHQRLTIESVSILRELTQVPVIPVLQGQQPADYLRHIDMYAAAGFDLQAEPVVGLGSVCRRQATREIRELVTTIASFGLRLHGFGVKTDGIDAYGPMLASADSFAWSFGARQRIGRCPHGRVVWEQNCPVRALEWREHVLSKLKE